jgi:membrane-associated phospholipid phosphatase
MASVTVERAGAPVRRPVPTETAGGLRRVPPWALGAGAVTLFYFVLFVAVLSRSPLVELDTDVLRQRAVVLALAATWLGVRALRTRDLRPLITLGVATLLLNVTVGLVKTLVGRLGPLQLGAAAIHSGASTVFSDGTIFPSGHAANAVMTWGLMAWLARRHRAAWGVAAGMVAVSIGLTTIYLGTHWVSDVLAGWAAGGLVLLMVPALAPKVDRLTRIAGAVLRRRRSGRDSALAVSVPHRLRIPAVDLAGRRRSG